MDLWNSKILWKWCCVTNTLGHERHCGLYLSLSWITHSEDTQSLYCKDIQVAHGKNVAWRNWGPLTTRSTMSVRHLEADPPAPVQPSDDSAQPDFMIANSQKTPTQKCPNPSSTETMWDNVYYCFKILSFRIICFTATGNCYEIDDVGAVELRVVCGVVYCAPFPLVPIWLCNS